MDDVWAIRSRRVVRITAVAKRFALMRGAGSLRRC